MFTGEPTLAAGFGAEPTSLVALPPEDVRRVVATAAELGDLLLRTMVTRREWLQGRGWGQQRLIGSRWSGEAFAVRELERNLVPFTWHDLATDEESRVCSTASASPMPTAPSWSVPTASSDRRR